MRYSAIVGIIPRANVDVKRPMIYRLENELQMAGFHIYVSLQKDSGHLMGLNIVNDNNKNNSQWNIPEIL